MVNGVLEVVPQLRRTRRTRHARAPVQFLVEALGHLVGIAGALITWATEGVAESAIVALRIAPEPLKLLFGLRLSLWPSRRPRLTHETAHGSVVAEATGIGGWSEGGEEFGLDNGSLDEEGIVKVHLEGDGPTRDQGHAHPAPVLVRRVLHHRPTLQVRLVCLGVFLFILAVLGVLLGEDEPIGGLPDGVLDHVAHLDPTLALA